MRRFDHVGGLVRGCIGTVSYIDNVDVTVFVVATVDKDELGQQQLVGKDDECHLDTLRPAVHVVAIEQVLV